MAGIGKGKITFKDREMPTNIVKEPETYPFHKLEDFRYVLPDKKQESVCFLSKKERETLPLRGASRFDMEHTQQRYPNVAPTTYEITSQFEMVSHKPTSQEAMLAVDSKRFSKWHPSMGPSPASYNLGSFPTTVKPNKYPFNSTTSRTTTEQKQIPGPGTYNPVVDPNTWKIPFTECFGTKRKMIPAVETKCYAINVDVCMICHDAPPKGDYWRYEGQGKERDQVMCRTCMAKMSSKWRKKREKEFKVFKKMRDCGFIHEHEKTRYKIYLISPKEFAKYQRKEAYFARYYTD